MDDSDALFKIRVLVLAEPFPNVRKLMAGNIGNEPFLANSPWMAGQSGFEDWG